jgi:hypothetical protein
LAKRKDVTSDSSPVNSSPANSSPIKSSTANSSPIKSSPVKTLSGNFKREKDLEKVVKDVWHTFDFDIRSQVGEDILVEWGSKKKLYKATILSPIDLVWFDGKGSDKLLEKWLTTSLKPIVGL